MAGRKRQIVISHEFQTPVHPKHGTMSVKNGINGIYITIIQYDVLRAAPDKVNRRANSQLSSGGHEMRIICRQEPPNVGCSVNFTGCGNVRFRVKKIVSTNLMPSARVTSATAAKIWSVVFCVRAAKS